MIRGTLTRGLNRLENAKHVLKQSGPRRPTVSFRSKEKKSTQKDPIRSPHPRYGPFETPLEPAERSPLRSRPPRRDPRQRTAAPPRSRVADLPSGQQANSASLEATPRQTELPIRRLTVRLTEAINANHSAAEWEVRRRQATTPHSGCDRNPIRQLRSLLSQPRHCGAIVGTCDALCERAQHCSRHCAANSPYYPVYFPRCGTFDRHRRDPRTRPGS